MCKPIERHTLVFLAITASFGLSACGTENSATSGSGASGGTGGSGGIPQKTGGTGGGGSPGQCIETPSVIAADQTTSLGFSANDVLAAVGAVHQTDLFWLSTSEYATNSRAGTTTSLELGFAATPTATRFIDSQGGGCPGGTDACWVCDPRLEIDLGLSLKSADQALDEQLTVTLNAKTKDAPIFANDIAAADVVGQYLDGVTPKAGYTIKGAHIEAGYGVGFSGSRATVPNQWNGFVVALLVPDSGGAISDIMQAHGYFPKATAGQ